MERSVIGILLDNYAYSLLKKGTKFFEKVHFYEEAAHQYQVKPCYFRLKDISFKNEKVSGYVMERDGKLVLEEISIPKIIHNRGIFFSKKAKEAIKELKKKGILIFNGWNRYGKLAVYNMLKDNEEIKPHLPETVLASRNNLSMMMAKHNELVIKPNNGSLGNGVIKLERIDEENWKVSFFQKSEKVWKEQTFSSTIPVVVAKRLISRGYIIQERIPLTTYKGSPFDLRVSVQRNISGDWQVTGIVGKVAKTGHFVTNVAKGGTCQPFYDLLMDCPQLDGKRVYKDIETLSLSIVEELTKHLPDLADVGLDMGLRDDGYPMFIECNGRDLRITFGRAGMIDEWKATFTTPMGYARYLLDSKIE